MSTNQDLNGFEKYKSFIILFESSKVRWILLQSKHPGLLPWVQRETEGWSRGRLLEERSTSLLADPPWKWMGNKYMTVLVSSEWSLNFIKKNSPSNCPESLELTFPGRRQDYTWRLRRCWNHKLGSIRQNGSVGNSKDDIQTNENLTPLPCLFRICLCTYGTITIGILITIFFFWGGSFVPPWVRRGVSINRWKKCL